MWKHNADVISTGNRYKINDDMSLTISPVRQSDEGRYVCEVTNRAGISATSEEIELCTMPSDYSKLPSEYSQLSETQLKTNEMEKINILMKEIPDNKTACIYFIGRYGAGKSSAISSFHSVNRGRITTIALPGGGDSSFTREVSCTEIFGGKVKLYDLPGYEGTRQFDGKQFSCISDDTTKANSEGDPPKCIVYVKDCSNQLTEEELEIMKQVHDYVKPRDNLQMVTLLTKIDRASQNAKTIPEMLISQELCTAVEQISGNVQLPVNCIFAMKNYHREMDSDPAIGWLILYTFRSLLDRLLDIHERLRLEKVVHT
ncbi:GTP-binding protein EngB [Mizuhopecten yessoensis]|uniref:GTP-binding protein EngB n=2 Tax=Mizuhopecten yessoensis TaxID=6573 RepID=A0A210QFP2_MIZYE|nr:GTP-binding protein EngB [Mizuhopecten yessoensis]